MAKYDWKQLEKEYILSDCKSVSQFIKNKQMPYNGTTKKKTKGWTEKKRLKQDQKETKIIEKVLEKEIEKEVDINTRHLKLYDSFLNVLENSFNNPNEYMYLGMPDYNKLKKMIGILEKSQKGQRLAKGLDKKSENSITQSLAETIQKAYENKAGEN